MKKVYLLITAICLTALTGCIKEEYTLEETAITVNVSTRATGTASTEQGDGIQDVNVWAFKYTESIENALENIGEGFTISYEYEDSNIKSTILSWKNEGETEIAEKVRITNAATAWSRSPVLAAWSSVDVHLQFKACTATEKYILVAVINQEQFGTIKVGSEEKTLGRYTTYSDLIKAKFVAPNEPNELMSSNPGNGSGADPDYMPISHWTTFDLTTAHAGKTHPNTCLEVPMPVYRALAKTQLLVAKSDANSTVTIKNVTLGSTAYPTEGALLSASVGTYANNKAGDFDDYGATTPQWYVSDVTKSATAVTKDILTAESVTIGNDYVLTEQEHNSNTVENFGDYQYITSYFLYENKGGNDGEWNKASKNGGYYMAVTYNVGAGDDITENVWLPAVVRNHDIQVRALVNAGGKMTLTFNVQPWTNVPTNWNYTDVVTINENGKLAWTSGTYEKIEDSATEENVKKVTMKKTGDGNYTNLQCTFHIDTPTDATWYASFISGDINSFEFVSANSGTVGKPATLTIKAKNSTITSSQMANLDIVIRTADGRTLKSSELTNGVTYQLVQNE